MNPGIIVSNGYTLTINGPVVGNPMHQWLNGFSGYDVMFGALVTKIWGEWFGLSGDGSTDNSLNLLVWLKCLSQTNAVSPNHRKKIGKLGLKGGERPQDLALETIKALALNFI